MKTQIKVKNYMEDLVANQLEDIIKKEKGICFCERCVADITAIALNNLPTKYVATEEGVCYAKLSTYENQFMTDIVTSILNAIDIVNKHPRHSSDYEK